MINGQTHIKFSLAVPLFNYIKIISFESSLKVLFYPLPIPYYDCVILFETNNFSMHFGNISISVSNA